jgi:hypothetical protein
LGVPNSYYPKHMSCVGYELGCPKEKPELSGTPNLLEQIKSNYYIRVIGLPCLYLFQEYPTRFGFPTTFFSGPCPQNETIGRDCFIRLKYFSVNSICCLFLITIRLFTDSEGKSVSRNLSLHPTFIISNSLPSAVHSLGVKCAWNLMLPFDP